MKILSLNFSPKGEKSISYHYYRYIEKILKNQTGDDIELFMISKEINKFINEKEYRDEMCAEVDNADIIIIISPVYAYIFPPDIKLFFDKIASKAGRKIFSGKYIYGIISSARVHDYLAIKDFNELCDKYAAEDSGLIALDMELKKNKYIVDKLNKFVEYIIFTSSLKGTMLDDSEKINSKVVILTDDSGESDTIKKIGKFLKNGPEVILFDKNKINFCRGDLACMLGNCIYQKDDFQAVYDKLMDSSIMIFEFTDPSISAEMRSFFSRAFSMGQHHESLPNKQIIVINENAGSLINEWAVNYAQMQSSNLAGFITGKTSYNDIHKMILKTDWCSKNGYIPPETGLKTASYGIFYEFIKKNGFALPKDIAHLRTKGDRSLLFGIYSLINKFWKLKFAKKILLSNVLSMITADHRKWLKKNGIT